MTENLCESVDYIYLLRVGCRGRLVCNFSFLNAGNFVL
jgi:hypothetical protein